MKGHLRDAYITRRVEHSFDGHCLGFYLSQALFSSYEIDRGSRLLLRAVTRQLDLNRVQTVHDLGCGVGILGLSLKKRHPHLKLLLTDRDALALAFSRLNARENGIPPVRVRGGLDFSGLEQERFDLIVSNLPAKAGQPVLQWIFSSFGRHLNPQGVFALVVVRTLRSLAQRAWQDSGAVVCLEEHHKEHSVFLVRPGRPDPTQGGGNPSFLSSPYIRGRSDYRVETLDYGLDTVYGLPEFDTLGFATRLLLDLFKEIRLPERVIFWNPGQGHLPLLMTLTQPGIKRSIALASRDLLQLQISRHNLGHSGFPPAAVTVHHLSSLRDLVVKDPHQGYQALVFMPDADPGPRPLDLLPLEGGDLLIGGGYLLLAARSALVHRLLQRGGNFKMLFTKKSKGFRAVCLELLT